MKKSILAQKLEAAGKLLAGHPVKVAASADGTRAEVMIYDVIGEDAWTGGGVTARAIASALNELRGADLLVRINSKGGDVVDGTAIYNAFAQHDGDVQMRIEGWACSMATVICAAGNIVQAYPNTMFMVHRASSGIWGNAKALRQRAALLDKVDGQIAGIYVSKTGKSLEDINAIMDGDIEDASWMTAAEAKESGFIDEVLDGEGKAVALLDKDSAKALAPDEGAQLMPTADLPDDLPLVARSLIIPMAMAALPPNISAVLGNTSPSGVVRMDGAFIAINAKQPEDEPDATDPPAADPADNPGGDTAGDPPADPPADPAAADTPPADASDKNKDPILAERERVKAIRAAAMAMGLEKMADHYIDTGVSAEEANKALLAIKAATQDKITSHHDSALGDQAEKNTAMWANAYKNLQ
ncbi:head maturation protease, ClpP-related [Aeromonas veronii]|uniref:head maturation protease, ClpP-related n=1 Tax=Aeromonas veronii TaxID=654 RepID=UPI0018F20E94|nr:head maturation protease, ClpP-related [Aeromonas veronii]MBJ7591987.1 Clp protease ClpP [Aeromonas veronii]